MATVAVGVQRREHQVTGERRFDRGLERLRIADFADHHDVRILSQDRAQPLANVNPALTLVCPWLMPGSQYSTGSSIVVTFLPDLGQLAERGVERRRLSAAGRAGHEDDALGLSDLIAERLERLAIHDAGDRLLQAAAIEQSQYGLFAPDRRVRRRADVEAAAVDRGAESPVLRRAMFGDVHPRQHLQARNDRRSQRRQQIRDLVQQAVDAEPDLEAVLVGLEVNVARAIADAAREDAIDDRRGRLQRALILQIELRAGQIRR